MSTLPFPIRFSGGIRERMEVLIGEDAALGHATFANVFGLDEILIVLSTSRRLQLQEQLLSHT